MVNLFLQINPRLNEFIWGPLMIVAILGCGIYLTIGSGFIQFLKFPYVLKETLIRKKKKDLEGDISPFQALNVALAGTVGVGNIAGVATAIAMGGPGAIFWMWVSGLLGIFEVFVDTIVICSATALAILITGVWKTGLTGAELTMSAFSVVYGRNLGFSLVAICMVLTAYDTMLAWGFYGETCSAYLFGPKARPVYRCLWLGPIVLGSLGKLETVWGIADTLNGLMAIPNLIALFSLGPVVFGLTKDFFNLAGSPRL